MKMTLISIRLMIYLIGFYLFVTSDFKLALFDYLWFTVFAFAYLLGFSIWKWKESEEE